MCKYEKTFLFDNIPVCRSKMFGFPTRLMDSWEPKIEVIELPEFNVSETTAIITINSEITKTYAEQRAFSCNTILAKSKNIIKKIVDKNSEIIKKDNRLVYDARGIDNSNIAHLIQHHLGKLKFAEKHLDIVNKNAISVVLNKKPNTLAVKFFKFLGYDVILTNGNVSGDIIKIDCKSFYHLLPNISVMEIPEYIKDTPKKIFISRKNTRALLNEKEIENYLISKGYKKIYFEDIPLCLQWSIMRNATDIVAIHGAALGSLAFNNLWVFSRNRINCFRLTELFGAGFLVDCFRRYTAVLKGSWTGCRGRISDKIIRDIDIKGRNLAHAFDNFEIDLKTLKNALEFHQ